MIISMQGNWTVTVKTKNASFPQRYVVQGALFGNGVHSGAVGTVVSVIGTQWSISIQHDPGTGWQSSQTKLKFPQKIGGKYVFDILSNDSGGDTDFDDLVLSCSVPVNINDFILYGNVTLYSGRCIFNPCRKWPFVIDTLSGLESALKNPRLSDWVHKYYPERIPPIKVNPNPPDPAPFFTPIVLDLSGEVTQPKTTLKFARKEITSVKKDTKKSSEAVEEFLVEDYELIHSATAKVANAFLPHNLEIAKDIDRLIFPCFTDPGSNLTLTFEEYDRTASELGGGAYTGTGNRRLLGDTITDMNGNYIFRFRFDMSVPYLEDGSDIASGENVNTIIFPDVIVKVVEYSPFYVRYESAPFYNVPNLKRIDLCLPESKIHVSSACFNGNLIGSLGNVFIGGNQNTTGSTLAANLNRYNISNYLESTGKISVNSPLAGFKVECAAWAGTIDIKGCMYDAAKTAVNNKIRWYTIRILRAGTSGWQFVSQNYKHPKFSKRNLPNYIGDDVGPFYPNVGGSLIGHTPAYINIQREIFVDGIDWEFSNMDRYMQLNTALYDVVSGIRTPGRFFLKVDGYDAAGTHVPNATDLIALFIHNNGLNFEMTAPKLDDPAILNAGCGLYRLTDTQMKTPVKFSFEANDPHGFVDNYALTIGRCPGTAIDLTSNLQAAFTLTGSHVFPGGKNPLNVHHACPGYHGTTDDYSNAGMINANITPPAAGDGWIKAGEYFTIYSFSLKANQRITNGYNSGVSGTYEAYGQIMMERLNP